MKQLKSHLLTSMFVAGFLFLFSIFSNFSISYMGVTDRNLVQMIIANYKFFIVLYNCKILAAYLLLGLLIGLFSFFLKISRLVNVALFSLFVWGMFWVRAIKQFPQLFLEQLFNKGGLAREFQLFLTDRMPPLMPILFLVLLIGGLGVRNRRKTAGTLILFICGLFVIRFHEAPLQVKTAGRPNVLIIGTDSLRPQSVSFNGYNRPTPAIDRLLAQGCSFLNARGSVARTFPFWTSLLTSQFSPEHMIRTMYPPQNRLHKAWLTLPDVFNRQGYFTAVASDFAGDMFSRIDYGFAQQRVPVFLLPELLKQRSLEIQHFLLALLVNPLGHRLFPELAGLPYYLDSYFVNENTKNLINQSVQRGQPFFIIYFSSNNHFPYVAPYPYYQFYTQPGYRGKHKYCLSSDMLKSFLSEGVSAADRQQIVDLYDGATRHFDDNLQDLLHFLKKGRLDSNTIIIVLSDHGENLFEDSLGSGHGDHLRGPYNNMLLGIRSPFENFGGKIISQTIRDIDIAPTLLDMLAIPIPYSFHGRSLLPALRGGVWPGLFAYSETGIWHTQGAPYIPDRLRLPYPDMKDMIAFDPRTGQIFMKQEYEQRVNEAKHRSLQLNGKKYIYMPGPDGYQEEFYLDEKPLKKEDIRDPDFLSFKVRIVEMFPSRFYLDSRGMIREK